MFDQPSEILYFFYSGVIFVRLSGI